MYGFEFETNEGNALSNSWLERQVKYRIMEVMEIGSKKVGLMPS